MRILLFALLAVAALSVVAPSSANADWTMRCPTGRIVRLGDRLLEVAPICGQPDWTDRRTALREVRGRARRVAWEQEESLVVEIRIDEWLYDLGPGRFLRRLVFENGRLVQIDTLGRGRDR